MLPNNWDVTGTHRGSKGTSQGSQRLQKNHEDSCCHRASVGTSWALHAAKEMGWHRHLNIT